MVKLWEDKPCMVKLGEVMGSGLAVSNKVFLRFCLCVVNRSRSAGDYGTGEAGSSGYRGNQSNSEGETVGQHAPSLKHPLIGPFK